MHDALLSRFRAAYLGAVLGEQTGRAATPSQPRLTRLRLGRMSDQGADRPVDWVEQILAQTRRLLGEATAVPQPNRDLSQRPTPDLFMARLLPLALLHHDQPQVLQQHLAQSWIEAKSANLDSPNLDSPDFWAALIWSQTVSLILRERFLPQTLIAQVLRDLDLPDLPAVTPLLSQLTTVQTWLTQSTDLATVTRRFQADLGQADLGQADLGQADLASESAVGPALASGESAPTSQFGPVALGLVLYSFLSSPEDLPAMLLRFARLQAALACGSPELTGTLLGALAGLYGGLPSLPFGWRQQRLWAEQSQAEQNTGAACSEALLFQQADRLLAQWSGVSPTADWWSSQPYVGITAAPRVIQTGPG